MRNYKCFSILPVTILHTSGGKAPFCILREHLYRCSPNITVKEYPFLFNCIHCYENLPNFQECVPIFMNAHYCSEARNSVKPGML